MSLSTLPPEMRIRIFELFWDTDLMSLSLCCKLFRDEITPLLWDYVGYSWKMREDMVSQLIREEKVRDNFQFTKRLHIHDAPESTSSSEFLAAGFKSLMAAACDGFKMQELTINHYLVPNGLGIASDFLKNMTTLCLFDIVDCDWRSLANFQALIYLRLWDVKLQLADWVVVAQLDKLQTLIVENNCKQLQAVTMAGHWRRVRHRCNIRPQYLQHFITEDVVLLQRKRYI